VSADDLLFPASDLIAFSARFLVKMGCTEAVASDVAEHLVDADLRGIYSHGIVRLTQYADMAQGGRHLGYALNPETDDQLSPSPTPRASK